MRKLLVLILSFMTGTALWAGWGSQYNYGDFYTISDNGGKHIVTTSDTYLSISKISSTGYDAFGYYTYAKGTTPSLNSVELKSLTFDKNGAASIGNVDKNTEVGFWISNANGTTYSTQSWNKNWFYATNVMAYSSTGDPIFSAGTYWDYNLNTLKFTITGSKAKPVGQPLPGVLASAVIGLASLTGWKFRRKKE